VLDYDELCLHHVELCCVELSCVGCVEFELNVCKGSCIHVCG